MNKTKCFHTTNYIFFIEMLNEWEMLRKENIQTPICFQIGVCSFYLTLEG